MSVTERPTTNPASDVSRSVRDKHKEYLLPATILYYKEPLVLTEGKGLRVRDADGNTYLDFFGGILTVSRGARQREGQRRDRGADRPPLARLDALPDAADRGARGAARAARAGQAPAVASSRRPAPRPTRRRSCSRSSRPGRRRSSRSATATPAARCWRSR